ncbi:MAG: transcription termination/antitermination protein NusG [bacterium]|nr:transcription termination/antitermination protein NusG [bacterium]
MARQTTSAGRRWYAVHTYSGYEENVAGNLRQRIDSMGMEDKIFNILIPKEKKIKIKNGKRRILEEKIFPGYVLVEMVVTDDSWYVVRNTPNVTGFIGTGTTPTPVSDEEINALKQRMGVEEPKYKIDVTLNSPVRITDGPFKDFEGKVDDIDEARGKVKVLVSMFGRETPVELDFLQIKKI